MTTPISEAKGIPPHAYAAHVAEVLARALMELLDYVRQFGPAGADETDRRWVFARDVNAAYWFKGPSRPGLVVSNQLKEAKS